MQTESAAKQNLPTKLLWGVSLLLGIAAFAVAVYESIAFTAHEFLVLAVAVAIAALVNQHQLTFFSSRISYSTKELSLLLGMIWLGVPGAVALGLCASAARLRFSDKERFDQIHGVSVNVIASAAAAFAFRVFLDRLVGFHSPAVADQVLPPLYLAGAVAVAAAVHFVVTRIFNTLYAAAKRVEVVYESLKVQLIRASIPYLFNFAATLLFHFLFSFFGLAFGWVILAVSAVGHLAFHIHSERLDQKVKEIREASRVHLATVEALASAIDARDQVGRGHVRRTQIYAVGIGEMLRLPEDDIQALRTGALLHDIGKLAVPDHILNKPGRLTPAEMEKIKIHASVGASILESIGFSNPVIPTIKYHHESWDGSGYPEGLKGKQIPLTARIMSVADAYDTLRGARPYRSAITKDEARRTLLNAAGTRFDPTVVDVFCRNLDVFEKRIAAEGLAYDADAADDPAFKKPENEGRSYIEQIKRANREVYTLYELARTFSSSLTTENIYSLFTTKIRELVPFDTCVIYQHNELTGEAQAVYAEGVNDNEILHIYVKSGEGGTGTALKRRQAFASTIPSLDFSFSQVALSYEYTAMASLPLIAKEKLLGAVSIYSCNLSEYEDEHLRLLETVSRIASDAIFKSINHAETESRALTDPMTGLPNARALQIQFEKESARAERNESRFQLLMLDLDGFKAVNDTFGHKVGDKLLKEISKVMRGQLRDYDFLARYAGDEFVAIVPETDDRSVQELAQRVERAVTNFVLPIGDGRFARVGISVGAASYPAGGKVLDQLLIAADKAMYDVKVRRKRLKLAAENSKAAAESAAKPQPAATQPQPAATHPPPIPVKVTETVQVNPDDVIIESHDENFLVELDESHIISSAIN